MKQDGFDLGKSVYYMVASAVRDFIRYYYKSEHNSDVDDLTLETLTFSALEVYGRIIQKYGKGSIIDSTIIVCLTHDSKSPKETTNTETFHRLRKELNDAFANTMAVLMETTPGYEIETNDE